MDESTRLIKSWVRIEHWLKENFPESLDTLQPPASLSHIKHLENTLEIPLPPAMKTLWLQHNGEQDRWPAGVFPNGQRLLSVAEILAAWKQRNRAGARARLSEQTEDYSQAPAEHRNTCVEGPVKPLLGSKLWIPIATARSYTTTFLDYDPPEGGIPGQVILANLNRGTYRVLAPSLIRYMEQYAMELSINHYTVHGDYIVPKSAAAQTSSAAGKTKTPVPEYLRKIAYQYFHPKKSAEQARVQKLEFGDEVVITGTMTSLMGEDEVLFTLQTENGREHTFLAKSSFTKGHGSIAIDQCARVKARKFFGEFNSHFIDQGLARTPDYMALEYMIVRTPLPTAQTNRFSETEPDTGIKTFTQSDRSDDTWLVKDFSQLREITLDPADPTQAKFYHHHTTRLLKLGFHYICDAVDIEPINPKINNPFRVMASADDGVVASFYHLQPKLTQRLLRWRNSDLPRVIQFETEFTDGHIIISTTVAQESFPPLPESITCHEHAPEIALEGLLHKHRLKIKRYQTRHANINVVKVGKTDEFFALRSRQYKLISHHIRSSEWTAHNQGHTYEAQQISRSQEEIKRGLRH